MSGHHCPRRKATARHALVGNLATVAAPMVRDSCVFSARPAATNTLLRACNSREQPAHHTQPPLAALLDTAAPEATTSALALIRKSTIASPLTACNNHRASLQFASSPRATTVAISSSTTDPSSLAHRTTTATHRQPALDNTIATSLQLIGVRERHLLRTSRCLNHHSRTSLTAIHCVNHAIVDIHRNRNKRDTERVLYRRTSGP
ncbi:hypothetical protein DEO72_LG8g2025 [Vigna unguiculata]|uniref:Uncharacterized protein n=1 Tax=Vigna unguiculata TaxID=3917 RepID=A0A4D6MRF3_VIGUN|nr:hypothetical protein DEO72_LG8g2025 [Vigna unguiculata]